MHWLALHVTPASAQGLAQAEVLALQVQGDASGERLRGNDPSCSKGGRP